MLIDEPYLIGAKPSSLEFEEGKSFVVWVVSMPRRHLADFNAIETANREPEGAVGVINEAIEYVGLYFGEKFYITYQELLQSKTHNAVRRVYRSIVNNARKFQL